MPNSKSVILTVLEQLGTSRSKMEGQATLFLKNFKGLCWTALGNALVKFEDCSIRHFSFNPQNNN